MNATKVYYMLNTIKEMKRRGCVVRKDDDVIR
jgi:hypothetical protein